MIHEGEPHTRRDLPEFQLAGVGTHPVWDWSSRGDVRSGDYFAQRFFHVTNRVYERPRLCANNLVLNVLAGDSDFPGRF